MHSTSNSVYSDSFRRLRSVGLSLAASAVVAACGGGAGTESLPPGTLPTNSDYNGPPPATADVQAFMVELWTNTRAGGTAGCGDCHSPEGGQSPMFGRSDDVNDAYAESNQLVSRDQASDSRLVTKLLSPGGHNCWLASDQACADIMTNWIEAWVGGSGDAGGRQIQLNAPPLNDPGDSRNWPDPVPAEFSEIHNLTMLHCGDCHASDGATMQQSPFFGDSDPFVAYEAAKSKINLDDPDASRLVVRLADEFHNCWEVPANGEVNCPASAAAMEAAITTLANSIPLTGVPDELVISKALTLLDGTVASGGNRYENNLIALWEFKAGEGNTAFDTSGVNPAIDLTLSGNDVSWVGGWGIDIREGKAQGSTAASRKLHDLIKATGEYSIEAWVAPGNVTQEDSRIISYSAGTMARNFTLGQTLYSYDYYNRNGASDANGDPVLTTSDADEDLQATLQHVVVNYDPVNGRQIYVNGQFTDDLDPISGDTLADWDDNFAFVLGNEVSNNRQWQGVIRMVAIHNRVLTPEQIQQNLDVGVGEKFFLLFSIADVIGVPDSYILFEVSQFDSYSYLFNTPIFISLDDQAQVNNVPLIGMQIGINGGLADVGQAYATLNTTLNDPQGQILSSLGTVVPLENGPAVDEFFLAFDQLGSEFGPVTPPANLNPPPEVLAGPQPDVGIRTFDEINASMSEVTGVPTTEVQATYDLVRQQLPGEAAVMTFSSAQQIGIAQLAIGYCDALVENDTYRSNFFDGYDFDDAPSVALASGVRGGVITPLINDVMGQLLNSQPDFNASYDELSALIDALIVSAPPPGGPPANSPQRTRDITKAACAAVLGSAPMLVQ
jgi:mono/diheme cytochrome c family protein